MEMTEHNADGTLNVAQHLIHQLARWGVKRVYGVIGDANLFLLDELGKQSELRYIACKHETNAALMASAEAKLTGWPTVCIATSGPGITSMLNGLADASCDRAPVLAITGQVERRHIGTGAVQDIDQQVLVQPLAVYSQLVSDSQSFPELLNLAMKAAINEGGVAHLSVPKEVWLLPVKGGVYPPSPSSPFPVPVPEQYQLMADVINEAERPVILAGRGIANAQQQTIALAEKIQAPIIATMPAQSFLPSDHPLFVGGLGQAGSEPASVLLSEADLCIVLGANWWPEGFVPESIPIVELDATAENIGQGQPYRGSLIGDMAGMLQLLVEMLEPKRNDAYGQEIQRKKDDWRARIQAEIDESKEHITPAQLMSELSQCVAPDAVLAVDVGDHTVWLGRIFRFQRQSLLISGNWRTLGFGLPAAIAAKLSSPERQVVCVAGDGGASYSILELATAVRYGLPLTMILVNNGTYAMESNRMQAEGLSTLGSEVMYLDYAPLARACGAESLSVTKPDELQPALERALSMNRPVLVDVKCTAPMLPHTKILRQSPVAQTEQPDRVSVFM
ncbi:thiamine pyrophosphate-binding protein [Paenibacillus xerothermodurans]|uniref:Thiamine pyrophosphate-binding protein n=1 Tax=Paenibacillus xerothermodurans TaxID=1977292 RepID=A0A2W1NAI1_PAEXE|nr:thiamine pyrophosphate-binding protein [Paenibacillus xerothermodurans]PZE21397.1 thiamine pyrophosphate-binding protein [Paenibacillus xerothermodurans]